jgi:hypothetical protein
MNTPRLSKLSALLTVVILLFSFSCAESKELTRARALTLIKTDKEFTEPALLVLRSGDTILVDALAADEPEHDAQTRAVEAYLNDHPVMAVFKYLNLIEVTADVVNKPVVIKAPAIIVNRPDGTVGKTPVGNDRLEPWKFLIRTSLTKKGKEAAQGDEKIIPIYTKRVLEVTGITNAAGMAGQAQAEFTWRIVPTAAGEALDPTSKVYKSLPPDLQQLLRQPQGLMQKTPLASTSEIDTSVRKGTASFQRYDDGWRLLGVR